MATPRRLSVDIRDTTTGTTITGLTGTAELINEVSGKRTAGANTSYAGQSSTVQSIQMDANGQFFTLTPSAGMPEHKYKIVITNGDQTTVSYIDMPDENADYNDLVYAASQASASTSTSGGGGTGPSPSNATPQQSTTSTGVPGTSALYSRGDHRHQAPAGTGEANVQSNWTENDTTSDAYILNKPTIPSPSNAVPRQSTTDPGQVGTSTFFARGDHRHRAPAGGTGVDNYKGVYADNTAYARGDYLYYDDPNTTDDIYMVVDPIAAGNTVKPPVNTSMRRVEAPLPLSNATPQQSAGTGTAGTSTDVSRADHRHQSEAGTTFTAADEARLDRSLTINDLGDPDDFWTSYVETGGGFFDANADRRGKLTLLLGALHVDANLYEINNITNSSGDSFLLGAEQVVSNPFVAATGGYTLIPNTRIRQNDTVYLVNEEAENPSTNYVAITVTNNPSIAGTGNARYYQYLCNVVVTGSTSTWNITDKLRISNVAPTSSVRLTVSTKRLDGDITASQIASGVIPSPSTTTPVQSGTTGSVGTSTSYARGDHRHQGDGAGGGGTQVEANPTDAGTADLTKLKVGTATYNVFDKSLLSADTDTVYADYTTIFFSTFLTDKRTSICLTDGTTNPNNSNILTGNIAADTTAELYIAVNIWDSNPSDPDSTEVDGTIAVGDYPSGTAIHLWSSRQGSRGHRADSYAILTSNANPTLVGTGNGAYLRIPGALTVVGTPNFDNPNNVVAAAKRAPTTLDIEISVDSISGPPWVERTEFDETLSIGERTGYTNLSIASLGDDTFWGNQGSRRGYFSLHSASPISDGNIYVRKGDPTATNSGNFANDNTAVLAYGQVNRVNTGADQWYDPNFKANDTVIFYNDNSHDPSAGFPKFVCTADSSALTGTGNLGYRTVAGILTIEGTASTISAKLDNIDASGSDAFVTARMTDTVLTDKNIHIATNRLVGSLNVGPLDLDATNNPTDTYVPEYDSATGEFTWVENTTGGGTTINPANDAPEPIATTAAIGTSTEYAREDHAHTAAYANISGTPTIPTVPDPANAVPIQSTTSAGVIGTSTRYARQDHRHQAPTGTGEVNVQANWNEPSNLVDSYIRNKPTTQVVTLYSRTYVNSFILETNRTTDTALFNSTDYTNANQYSLTNIPDSDTTAGLAVGGTVTITNGDIWYMTLSTNPLVTYVKITFTSNGETVGNGDLRYTRAGCSFTKTGTQLASHNFSTPVIFTKSDLDNANNIRVNAINTIGTSGSDDEFLIKDSSEVDGVNWFNAYSTANPIQSSNTGTPGTAKTFARSDHRHQGDGTVSLSDATPSNTGTSGSAGTSDDASRADHVHQTEDAADLSDDIPSTTGTSGSAGTSDEASRADHVHQTEGPFESINLGNYRGKVFNTVSTWNKTTATSPASGQIKWTATAIRISQFDAGGTDRADEFDVSVGRDYALVDDATGIPVAHIRVLTQTGTLQVYALTYVHVFGSINEADLPSVVRLVHLTDPPVSPANGHMRISGTSPAYNLRVSNIDIDNVSRSNMLSGLAGQLLRLSDRRYPTQRPQEYYVRTVTAVGTTHYDLSINLLNESTTVIPDEMYVISYETAATSVPDAVTRLGGLIPTANTAEARAIANALATSVATVSEVKQEEISRMRWTGNYNASADTALGRRIFTIGQNLIHEHANQANLAYQESYGRRGRLSIATLDGTGTITAVNIDDRGLGYADGTIDCTVDGDDDALIRATCQYNVIVSVAIVDGGDALGPAANIVVPAPNRTGYSLTDSSNFPLGNFSVSNGARLRSRVIHFDPYMSPKLSGMEIDLKWGNNLQGAGYFYFGGLFSDVNISNTSTEGDSFRAFPLFIETNSLTNTANRNAHSNDFRFVVKQRGSGLNNDEFTWVPMHAGATISTKSEERGKLTIAGSGTNKLYDINDWVKIRPILIDNNLYVYVNNVLAGRGYWPLHTSGLPGLKDYPYGVLLPGLSAQTAYNSANTYAINSVVSHASKNWMADAPIAANEAPGISDKWRELVEYEVAYMWGDVFSYTGQVWSGTGAALTTQSANLVAMRGMSVFLPSLIGR